MTDLLPVDVSNLGLAGCAIAIALGGFLRGFLGFGAALLMVPILSSILTPAVGLVIMYLVEVPTVLYLMPPALKKGNVKIVLPMILALLVTIPIGFYFVVSLDPEIIRIVISVMVILMVALLASGWKPKGEINLLTMILVHGHHLFHNQVAHLWLEDQWIATMQQTQLAAKQFLDVHGD